MMYAISKVSPKTPYLGKMDPTIPAMQGPRKDKQKKYNVCGVCQPEIHHFLQSKDFFRRCFVLKFQSWCGTRTVVPNGHSFFWSILVSVLGFIKNIMQHMNCLESETVYQIQKYMTMKNLQLIARQHRRRRVLILLILNVSALSILVQTFYDKTLNTIPTAMALNHWHLLL